jgi:hypothetical protein
VALRFLRALHEGLHVSKTDAAAFKRVLRKYAQTDDEAVLQATFEYYRDYFPDSMRVDERAIRNALRLSDHPAAKDADPRTFYDNSLLDTFGG